MTHLINNLYAVSVPEDAYVLPLHKHRLTYISIGNVYETILPPGQYKILFLTNQATEEDWEGVVGLWASNLRFYRNYNWPKTKDHYYDTATESGASLLASKGCVGNHVVIEKISN